MESRRALVFVYGPCELVQSRDFAREDSCRAIISSAFVRKDLIQDQLTLGRRILAISEKSWEGYSLSRFRGS